MPLDHLRPLADTPKQALPWCVALVLSRRWDTTTLQGPTMPLTPDEAIEKNKGKRHLQLERAIQDLLAEVEEAVKYYTGDPIYVGLSAYLQYKVQADNARDAGQFTLDTVDSALEDRFGPYGWKVGTVNNESESYYWAKLKDARED
jgi:hypothetical protein